MFVDCVTVSLYCTPSCVISVVSLSGSLLRLCVILQVYRHVDNVMFENAHLVERFLNYWRSTGHQRIGFLYGRYEIHADVPLGIRATVAAIYEPPQVITLSLSMTVLLEKKCSVITHCINVPKCPKLCFHYSKILFHIHDICCEQNYCITLMWWVHSVSL
jgi:hypothetical protein